MPLKKDTNVEIFVRGVVRTLQSPMMSFLAKLVNVFSLFSQ